MSWTLRPANVRSQSEPELEAAGSRSDARLQMLASLAKRIPFRSSSQRLLSTSLPRSSDALFVVCPLSNSVAPDTHSLAAS